jgi:hypothetical protein
LPALTEEAPIVSAASLVTPFPMKAYAAPQEMRRRREQAARSVDAAPEGIERLKAKQAHLYSRIEEYYASLPEAGGRMDVELTAIGVGSTAITSFPGEVFVSLSLDIRQRSPFTRTFFAGLANDYVGYIPTADARADSGYEVVAARVAPSAAGVLCDSSVGLLHQLKQAAES